MPLAEFNFDALKLLVDNIDSFNAQLNIDTAAITASNINIQATDWSPSEKVLSSDIITNLRFLNTKSSTLQLSIAHIVDFARALNESMLNNNGANAPTVLHNLHNESIALAGQELTVHQQSLSNFTGAFKAAFALKQDYTSVEDA